MVKGDFANTSIAMDIRLDNLFDCPRRPAPAYPSCRCPTCPRSRSCPRRRSPRLPGLPIPGLPGSRTSGSVNRGGGFLGVGLG